MTGTTIRIAGGADAIRFLDFATGQSKEVVKFEEGAIGPLQLAVSPDRKTLLYTQREEVASDLMLVEGFR
ncbi:MAG: hypothetical protein GY953_58645 [bacterium]|nr:hypothetical protein [bacterium]